MKGEFYKMDFRAWNIGTVDLTLEQEAAYLRLCHAMYDVGGPVPNSTRFLQGIFRCGNTKAASLLNSLIKLGKIAVTAEGKLINHRVVEELADRERVSSVRRAAGERGGSAPRATGDRLPTDPRPTPERPPSDPGANGRKPLENKETDKAIATDPRSREEERREEKSKDPQDPNGSLAPKGAKDAGTRIPDLFETLPEAREAVRSFGYGEDEIDEVLAEFCDYWRALPGRKAKKLNWIMTLRNRLRDVRDRPSRQPAKKASSGNGMIDLWKHEYGDDRDDYASARRVGLRLIAGARH